MLRLSPCATLRSTPGSASTTNRLRPSLERENRHACDDDQVSRCAIDNESLFPVQHVAVTAGACTHAGTERIVTRLLFSARRTGIPGDIRQPLPSARCRRASRAAAESTVPSSGVAERLDRLLENGRGLVPNRDRRGLGKDDRAPARSTIGATVRARNRVRPCCRAACASAAAGACWAKKSRAVSPEVLSNRIALPR